MDYKIGDRVVLNKTNYLGIPPGTTAVVLAKKIITHGDTVRGSCKLVFFYGGMSHTLSFWHSEFDPLFKRTYGEVTHGRAYSSV